MQIFNTMNEKETYGRKLTRLKQLWGIL